MFATLSFASYCLSPAWHYSVLAQGAARQGNALETRNRCCSQLPRVQGGFAPVLILKGPYLGMGGPCASALRGQTSCVSPWELAQEKERHFILPSRGTIE